MTIFNGISRRWFLNVFCVIFIFLLLFEVVFSIVLSNTYYNSASQYMISRANITTQFFNKYSKTQYTEFYSGAIKLADDFTEKEKMEIQIVDLDGVVINSSVGYLPSDKVSSSDFKAAIWGETSSAMSINKENREKVLSVSAPLRDASGNVRAIARFVTSYEEITATLILFIGMSIVVSILVLIMVFISGLYFLRSIVRPLAEVTSVANSISSGDLTHRVPNKYKYEVSELANSVNDMANELSQSEFIKNDFISSISHELRTPLTAIKGWSETMLGCDLSQEADMVSKGLTIINTETDRLKKMLDELLDFSKMQNQRLVLTKEVIDIGQVLIETVYIMKERANKEGIVLEFAIANELPMITGDKNRLKQVFLNIIDNSLKHSKEGQSISVTADFKDNIIIKIIDTGEGIPEALLPKVKEKFVKGDNSKKGSGLGLAIANEIIIGHGGKFEIDSVFGEGTTVTITFPSYTPETEI
ncbi:MAG: ATP-binding protein [Clostridia bacterium]